MKDIEYKPSKPLRIEAFEEAKYRIKGLLNMIMNTFSAAFIRRPNIIALTSQVTFQRMTKFKVTLNH